MPPMALLPRWKKHGMKTWSEKRGPRKTRKARKSSYKPKTQNPTKVQTAMKKYIKIVVFSGTSCKNMRDWPPENALDNQQWFQNKIYANVPIDHLHSATVVFGSDYNGDGDEEYPTIEISYTRPETDAEEAERVQIEVIKCLAKERYNKIRDLAEHRLYLELHAKYGDTGC